MHCPQCDALLPMRAEFCPQCGTPTSPRLRARETTPNSRTDEELKNNRKRVFVIAAAFLFGALVGGQSNWFNSGFDFGHDRDGRPAVVQAQQLFEAYRDDADEADDRFDDRFMVVRGEFVGIRPDDQGNPDLRFRTSDPVNSLGADLVRSSHAESARLQPGQMVTVACEGVARTGEEHWLRDCSIESVEPLQTAQPVQPAQPAAQPAGPTQSAEPAAQPAEQAGTAPSE